MERRAVILAMALTLPLALYGVPYAYASTTSSTYNVYNGVSVGFGETQIFAQCNAGDYVTGGGFDIFPETTVITSEPLTSTNAGWLVKVTNYNSGHYYGD